MKIYQVNQVVVYRVSANPLTLSVHASGLVATSGWTDPKLDNSQDPNPADAVLEFSFEATRPTGIVLEVLSPISVAVEVKPKGGADAVIVSSRTNSVTVHASEFVDPRAMRELAAQSMDRMTTQALGEECWPPNGPIFTGRLGEHMPTTFALGEEGGPRPPITNPMVDDPMPYPNPALDPGFDPWGPLRGSFGRFR